MRNMQGNLGQPPDQLFTDQSFRAHVFERDRDTVQIVKSLAGQAVNFFVSDHGAGFTAATDGAGVVAITCDTAARIAGAPADTPAAAI